MGYSSQAPNQGCRVNDTPLSNDDPKGRTWESCYWAEYALGYLLRSFDSMAGTLIWHIRLNLGPFYRRFYAFVTGHVCAWSAKTETFRPRALFNLLVIPFFFSSLFFHSFAFPSPLLVHLSLLLFRFPFNVSLSSHIHTPQYLWKRSGVWDCSIPRKNRPSCPCVSPCV